jgi:protein-arginine deiminase
MRAPLGPAIAALALALAFASAGCGGTDPSPPPPGDGSGDPPPSGFEPVVDLRGDVDRDGVASIADGADETGEDAWTPSRGAVFLANLDDDEDRCAETFEDRPEFSDDLLAACHDAADEAVNGPDDLLDLAPLATVPWPAAPDDAVGALSVSPPAAAARTRLFRRAGDAFVPVAAGEELPAAALREGLVLRFEGRDVVRDPAVWDGLADVTFAIRRRGAPATRVADTVRLRVAPIVLLHSLLPAEQVVVPVLSGAVPGDEDDAGASAAFRTNTIRAPEKHCRNAGLFQAEKSRAWITEAFNNLAGCSIQLLH